MFSHQGSLGYGGVRKDPSNAHRQRTPAQVAESIREGDSGFCQLQADEGLGLVVG
jgi:hypothetical protein